MQLSLSVRERRCTPLLLGFLMKDSATFRLNNISKIFIYKKADCRSAFFYT